jgi:hypothetical protein
MEKIEILEPKAVKAQAIKSATEAATLLLKIDDVIASAKTKGPPPGAEGGADRDQPVYGSFGDVCQLGLSEASQAL